MRKKQNMHCKVHIFDTSKKIYFCPVQAWEMTLKSFYHGGMLESLKVRLSEVSAWGDVSGVRHKPRCTFTPSAGPRWQSTAVTHWAVPQRHSTVARRLSGAQECTLCLTVKTEWQKKKIRERKWRQIYSWATVWLNNSMSTGVLLRHPTVGIHCDILGFSLWESLQPEMPMNSRRLNLLLFNIV